MYGRKRFAVNAETLLSVWMLTDGLYVDHEENNALSFSRVV